MNEQLNGWARSTAFGAVVVLVIRAVAVAFGLALMAIGVVMTPLPIPVGIPLLVLGMLISAAASKTLHRIITGLLRRNPWIWRKVRWAFNDKDKAADPAE